MSVHATIKLSKTVDDLDKADDWFAWIVELLQGHTDCRMSAASSNHEQPIVIKKET